MINEHILKVGIAPVEQFKARTMAIARANTSRLPTTRKSGFRRLSRSHRCCRERIRRCLR